MRTTRAARFVGVALALVCLGAARLSDSQTLTGATTGLIDSAVQAVLTSSGAPSASIAVVQGGRLVYEKAYGSARVGPPAVPALPAMRYSIGSISKQFLAVALLLLAEDGRLSVDDRVASGFRS
jgi:D-alanyl-D-alanine carboxypeptidase